MDTMISTGLRHLQSFTYRVNVIEDPRPVLNKVLYLCFFNAESCPLCKEDFQMWQDGTLLLFQDFLVFLEFHRNHSIQPSRSWGQLKSTTPVKTASLNERMEVIGGIWKIEPVLWSEFVPNCYFSWVTIFLIAIEIFIKIFVSAYW